MDALYHVSSEPGIARFEPRPDRAQKPGRLDGAMVWAIDAAHLANQLLPRDCPRVTFAAGPARIPADVERFLSGTTAARVIAIEGAWLPQLLAQTVYGYEFAAGAFACVDAGAGTYISREAVVPLAARAVDNLPAALLALNAALRLLPALWPLCDLVAASTLEFSIIRMRNARPPMDGYVPRY